MDARLRLAVRALSALIGGFVVVHETVSKAPPDPILVGAGVGLLTGVGLDVLTRRA